MHRWQENGLQGGGLQESSDRQGSVHHANAWEGERARIREFLRSDDELPAFGRRRFSARLAPVIAPEGSIETHSPFRRPSAITSDFFERLRDTPSEHEIAAHEGGGEGGGTTVGWRNILRCMLPLAFVALAMPQLGLLFFDGAPSPIPVSQAGATQAIDPLSTASVKKTMIHDGSLEVSQVSLITLIRGGERYLSVRGRVTNKGAPATGALTLRVEIADRAGMVLQGWDHQLPVTALSANAGMRFSTLARDESGRAARARIVVLENGRK
jgi:hypothetical protein